MRKCPRCHTSMLLDFGESVNGYAQTWRCLGCGREMYLDSARQEEDDRLVVAIHETIAKKNQL